MNSLKSFIAPLKSLTIAERKELILILALYFQSLFSYPLFRSATDALFIDAVGASKTPLVWLFSIILLTICVFIYNRFYRKIGVPKLLIYSVLLTISLFIVLVNALEYVNPFFSYPLYVLKEVYIILFIHMALGLANAVMNLSQAKVVFGLIGALGGLGGILGGLVTVKLAGAFSETQIIYVACIILLPCAIYGYKLNKIEKDITPETNKDTELTPLASIKGVEWYVAGIVLIICLSQFAVNIVAFDFKMFVGETIKQTSDKTAYFGKIYTLINSIALLTQVLFVPLLFKFIPMKFIHFGVPIFFIFLTAPVYLLGIGGVSVLFTFFKGLDYSLFSSAKELLYYPLTKIQKYGAKYISDMIFYRLAKGVISFFLIYYQDREGLRIILFVILFLWVFSIGVIFKVRPKKNVES